MIERTRFNQIKPAHAEGFVRVDLTDPITGKVKQRAEGKNKVYTETLFSPYATGFTSTNYVYQWQQGMLSVPLLLTDSVADVNENIPYLFGKIKGYGRPSTNGSGIYRGAFNSANQVLQDFTFTRARYKYQYDFTSAQAIGTIGTVGLSFQASFGEGKVMPDGLSTNGYSTSAPQYPMVNDGQYTYYISTAGVIQKWDLLNYTYTSINVSAAVGATGNKTVGWDPSTGYYFVYVYSATASSRKIYVFSDNTFSSLITSYTVSNIGLDYANYAFYISGNYMFLYHSSYGMYYADFVNNVAPVTVANTQNAFSLGENGSSGRCPACFWLTGNYLVANVGTNQYYYGGIFDMSSKTWVADLSCLIAQNAYSYGFKHPASDLNYIVSPYGISAGANYPLYHKTAIAQKKLDAPVVKDSSHGMTVTYELEIYW